MKKIIFTLILLSSILSTTLAQNKGYQILKKPPGEFNESDATYIDINTPVGSSLRLDSSFAIDCWIYLDSNDASGNTYIISTRGTSTSGGFEFAIVDTVLHLYIYSENSARLAMDINNGAVVPTNEWVHVAVTLEFRGERIIIPRRTFYINGVEAGKSQKATLAS